MSTPHADTQHNGRISRQDAGYSAGEKYLDHVADQLTIDDLRELVQFALAAADGLGLTSAGIWLDRAVVALDARVLDAADRPG